MAATAEEGTHCEELGAALLLKHSSVGGRARRACEIAKTADEGTIRPTDPYHEDQGASCSKSNDDEAASIGNEIFSQSQMTAARSCDDSIGGRGGILKNCRTTLKRSSGAYDVAGSSRLSGTRYCASISAARTLGDLGKIAVDCAGY